MKPADKLDAALKAAREKAMKEADFDDDGDVDAEDFLKTKNGRRALGIAALVVFILLAIAFGSPAKAAGEEPVDIPMDCGQAVCVIPKEILLAILKGHNATVDENRRMKAQLGGKVRVCPGEKES